MRATHQAIQAGFVAMLAAATPAAALQQSVALPRETRELHERPADVFSVGAEEGESWELLSHVLDAAFDEAGSLYVLDAGSFRVLVFDAEGNFMRQIGGQGDGPGEITFPTGLVVTNTGSVVVADMGRSAFTVFSRDGTYQRQVPWSDGALAVRGIETDGSGGVLVRMNPSFRLSPGQDATTLPNKAAIRHFAMKDGADFTTLFEFELPRPQITSSGGANQQRVQVRLASPTFSPEVSWGSLPSGGVALVDGVEYEVRIMDAGGTPVRTITRDEKPREVTERDRDRARERQRAVLAGETPGPSGVRVANDNGRMSYGFASPGAMPPEQIEQRIREMQFAEILPLITGISTDPVGRIWVERTTTEGANGPIELITDEGRYIGTVRGIARPAAVSRDGGRAAWIETDELGVERVVVRSLPAAWM